MENVDFIVEELHAIRRDGSRSSVRVRVGKPFRDAPGDDPQNNTHVCEILCEGVDERPIRVCGEGPMQALHLGLEMIRLHLDLAEKKGLRFVYPETEDANDWRAFWYAPVGLSGE